MKQDRREELYGLLARIGRRRTEAEAKGKEIEAATGEVFDDNQANVEILRRKAQGGDAAAEAAYMALLRGRKTVA